MLKLFVGSQVFVLLGNNVSRVYAMQLPKVIGLYSYLRYSIYNDIMKIRIFSIRKFFCLPFCVTRNKG